jgi:hypothetical protein
MPRRAFGAAVTAPQAAPSFLAEVNPPGRPSGVVFLRLFLSPLPARLPN